MEKNVGYRMGEQYPLALNDFERSYHPDCLVKETRCDFLRGDFPQCYYKFWLQMSRKLRVALQQSNSMAYKCIQEYVAARAQGLKRARSRTV